MSPDAHVAMTNDIMRERIVPALPPESCALLLVATGTFVSYIANAPRAEARDMLRRLLDKWDADDKRERDHNAG